MTLPPLTHHEIVRLVEPFARRGRHVDLAASDRAARRIVFRPAEVVLQATPGVAWHEILELEAAEAQRFVLRRRLVHGDGLLALAEACGPDPAALLERIEAVPHERHVRSGPGWLVVRSYDADPPPGMATGQGPSPLVLTTAWVHAGGLVLELRIRLPRLRGIAADLSLHAAAGSRPPLPEDLLAVLGWDWARLVPGKEGWTSKLRLRGAVLRRSRTAEGALEQVAAHLVRVMAEPPAMFHDRHRLARWGVVLRRGIPSLTAVFMIVGALLLPKVIDPSQAGIWMALHYLPIALLAVAFQLQELPRFEIPPLPRRPRAPDWQAPAAAPGGVSAGAASR